MVHNGIEYGMMAAYAEGLNILHNANVGKREPAEADAETTPLAQPEYYQYDIDTTEVAEVWRRGSVIASWLLDLTATPCTSRPEAGRVLRPGVGLRRGPLDLDRRHRRGRAGAGPHRRAVRAVLVRGEPTVADKVLSAMRKEFGGHDEKPAQS